MVKVYAVDRDGTRTEITDLYWFEENGIHTFDDSAIDGSRVEVEETPVPRCDQCMHYELVSQTCEEMMVFTNHGSDVFSTRPDFGCVLWKARAR